MAIRLPHLQAARLPAGTVVRGGGERAISAAGQVIVHMADFPAADQPPARVCAERVRGREVYVGVLGTRYGSPVRDKREVIFPQYRGSVTAR